MFHRSRPGTNAAVFVIWEVGIRTLGQESSSWHWPALALVAGTTFGASDFATSVPKRLAEERGTSRSMPCCTLDPRPRRARLTKCRMNCAVSQVGSRNRSGELSYRHRSLKPNH
jgi:hypothetical protein